MNKAVTFIGVFHEVCQGVLPAITNSLSIHGACELLGFNFERGAQFF